MGLMLISFPYPPPVQFHSLSSSDRHRLLGGGLSAQRRTTRLRLLVARDNTVRDHRLVSVDGDVFDDDLLLASASVLVEPFGQKRNCPRGFVSELQVFCMSLEMLAG